MLKRVGNIGEMPIRYLGREWRRTKRCFYVKQLASHYEELVELTEVDKRTVLSTVPGSPTPGGEEPLSTEEHRLYRSIVGKLSWMCSERTDMLYAVKELARGLRAPTNADVRQATKVVQYAVSTRNVELKLEFDRSLRGKIQSFGDSNLGDR